MSAANEDQDQRLKTLLREFAWEFFDLFFPNRAGRLDFSRAQWRDQEAFVFPPRGRAA